ncbi:MAG: protoglobin domain-containing protein [Halanaeroarchaeum sp.]
MSEYAELFGRGALNERIDSDALLSDIGLDREEIDWRKQFIGFDGDDVERLTRYQDAFERRGGDVADLFYDNLTQYEETTDVISRSPKGVEQLKRTQEAYLNTLAGGEYGEAYFRDRARIGKLHDLLEMPMNHYIGQYGVYYDLLVPLVTDRVKERVSAALEGTGEGPAESDGGAIEGDFERSSEDAVDVESMVHEAIEEGFEEFHSILKIINLDMQVVADTYIHSYTAELETTVREQREVANRLGEAVGELSTASENVAGSSSEISDLARSQHERMDQVADEVSAHSTSAWIRWPTKCRTYRRQSRRSPPRRRRSNDRVRRPAISQRTGCRRPKRPPRRWNNSTAPAWSSRIASTNWRARSPRSTRSST